MGDNWMSADAKRYFSKMNASASGEAQALSELNKTYDSMIEESDKYFQAQIDAAQKYADTQSKIQQEKTDFAIEQINQQKDQAKKDYTREQSGAYVDWQKQSDEYGANAEQMAVQGMGGTGYSESSQVAMYNQYQTRVATARESYNRAVLNYDNAIKDAQIQNNAALAEIAYQALQTQLELSLEGFQYKNQLIIDKTKMGLEVENTYFNRYQAVYDQIQEEEALAEEIRQYNESLALEKDKMAEDKRQYNESLALQKAQLAEQQRQFNVQQAAKKASSSGGSSGGSSRRSSGGSVKKSSSSGSSSSVKKSGSSTKKNTTKQNTSAYAYLNALIASGASKDKVSNEIAIALREGAISKAEAQKLRSVFTPRGLAY